MPFPVRSFITTVAAFVAVVSAQSVAHAHFIWATVQNGQARFALLENPNEAPHAEFADYVAHLSPRSGEKPLTLLAPQAGARFAGVPVGTTVVTAESIVGTKERGAEPYLLVYHAKGAVSFASAGTSTDAPAEITARAEGQTLLISARQNGKSVGECEVWVQWPSNSTEAVAKEPSSVKTDAKGEVKIPWPATPMQNGFVGVRAMITEAKSGEDAAGKKYTSIHRWVTLTFPMESVQADAGVKDENPFTQIIRAALGDNHEIVSNAAFNQTVFAGKLTKPQLIIHLQQRALVHNEVHRILIAGDAAARPVPYGAEQKNVLVLLFTDLIALGSGWPTENQARPLTKAFLQEIRDSEAKGPFFALGIQHVYFGGITNGGRTIGEKIGETLHFTPTYYEKSDGYPEYLVEVNEITDKDARSEMIRGAQAAYRYIIASSNEDVFKSQ